MANQSQNESQSNIPHLRLLDFMRTVTPFDTLASQELEKLVSRMEISFFPRGKHVVDKDAAGSNAIAQISKDRSLISRRISLKIFLRTKRTLMTKSNQNEIR